MESGEPGSFSRSPGLSLALFSICKEKIATPAPLVIRGTSLAPWRGRLIWGESRCVNLAEEYRMTLVHHSAHFPQGILGSLLLNILAPLTSFLGSVLLAYLNKCPYSLESQLLVN
jgi:hypothetical protein